MDSGEGAGLPTTLNGTTVLSFRRRICGGRITLFTRFLPDWHIFALVHRLPLITARGVCRRVQN